MTKIKICGLTRIEDITYVNEARPDYIGFVFADSKRKVTIEQAREFKKALDKEILAVGVFVDEEIEVVKRIAEEGIIDLIQLHGKEDTEYVKKLKSQVSIPVIKAWKAGSMTEEEINEMPADYDLIDSGKGSGKTFDWNLVPHTKRRWFLAGGLSEKNIEEAIETLRPYAVDFSSSVETNGKKDREKITRIVRRIRNVKR